MFFYKLIVDKGKWVVTLKREKSYRFLETTTIPSEFDVQFIAGRFWDERSLTKMCLAGLLKKALRTGVKPKTIQSVIDMVKLLRVYGECLGVERRRRTW